MRPRSPPARSGIHGPSPGDRSGPDTPAPRRRDAAQGLPSGTVAHHRLLRTDPAQTSGSSVPAGSDTLYQDPRLPHTTPLAPLSAPAPFPHPARTIAGHLSPLLSRSPSTTGYRLASTACTSHAPSSPLSRTYSPASPILRDAATTV